MLVNNKSAELISRDAQDLATSIRGGGLPERPFLTACFLRSSPARHTPPLPGEHAAVPCPAPGAAPTARPRGPRAGVTVQPGFDTTEFSF